MSYYKLKARYKNSEIEVESKNPELIVQELDKYLEFFASNKKMVPTENFNTVQSEEEFKPIALKSEGNENTVEISFKDFMDKYQDCDIFSKLIVGAYYFKRILNQNSFVLKTLNSKLYPLVGQIIDLSVLNDAASQDFISAWEDDGKMKYCLSDRGESYYFERFNR